MEDNFLIENQNVAICDISGRTIFHKQLESGTANNSMTISRNVFSKGICFVKVGNEVAKLVVE